MPGSSRVCIADTDAEALRDLQEPLRWNREMPIHVHERGETIDAVPTLPDGSTVESTAGEFPATVIRQLHELHALGLRRVIGWFHSGTCLTQPFVDRCSSWLPTVIQPIN